MKNQDSDDESEGNSDTELEIGDYCYCDDEMDHFCVILDVIHANDSVVIKIFDFEENRKRITVKSSLCKVEDHLIDEMKQKENEYRSKQASNVGINPKHNNATFEFKAQFKQLIVNKVKNCDMQKLWCYLCAIAWTFVALSACTALFAFITMDWSSDFATNRHKEECIIYDYDIEQCRTDDDFNGENIIYYATIKNKCSYKIFQNTDYYQYQCERGTVDIKYEIGQSYSCYIIDCKDGRFTFQNHVQKINTIWNVIIAMSIIVCVCACVLHQSKADKTLIFMFVRSK
eukprot:274794_1